MNVNTTGRETTPFITQDGRFLFFSSDGHIGMGGLDIYVSENLGDSWGDPINLGYGINTVNNDSHFVYSKELNKGLDLKGGIDVTLQVSVKDILKGLSENSKDPVFNKALNDADILQKESDQNYVESLKIPKTL